ncbi:transcription factor IIIA-like [Amphibalanus amphitrite]|uniref:transcription factor IIIA-like n=1 Tax=Amphibalanus amphitrite TaxID=1232801 RepID=UPI001C920981|nr:transcription factor IIIA-like [Amphibalanus amphitrite]
MNQNSGEQQRVKEPQELHKKHICEYAGCGASFQRPGRLKIHYRTHTGEKPFKCDRPGCDKSYSRREHLRRHLASHDTKNSPSREAFKCPVEGCGKYLSSLDTYQKHGRSHQRRQYVCSHCGRGFIKRQHLRIHEHEHTGVKPFRCSREGCGREFLLPSQLRAHERHHDKYRCPVDGCGQQLDSWKQLLQHRRQLHPAGREHTCSECDHKFLSKSALRIHKRVHGETRDIFHCPYDDCPRYYYFKRNLSNHVRSSHEGKGFICPVETCKKKLSCKKKLDDHARLHDPSLSPRKPRKKQRERRDKGVKRGPATSAFHHLTGEAEPSDAETAEPPPAVDIDPTEVDRLVEDAERLAWQCDAPSRKQPQLAFLGPPPPPPPIEWVQLVKSSSEAESGDESVLLLL